MLMQLKTPTLALALWLVLAARWALASEPLFRSLEDSAAEPPAPRDQPGDWFWLGYSREYRN